MKIIATTLIMLLSTGVLNAQKMKKVSADFPKEMLTEVKADYQKIYDKGQILYNINCAKCHNTPQKKVEILPEFTLDQLKGYELRESNPRHVEGIPETQVSPEELGEIMIFLTYKKKNAPAK
jgi:hypothetical protein